MTTIEPAVSVVSVKDLVGIFLLMTLHFSSDILEKYLSAASADHDDFVHSCSGIDTRFRSVRGIHQKFKWLSVIGIARDVFRLIREKNTSLIPFEYLYYKFDFY